MYETLPADKILILTICWIGDHTESYGVSFNDCILALMPYVKRRRRKMCYKSSYKINPKINKFYTYMLRQIVGELSEYSRMHL